MFFRPEQSPKLNNTGPELIKFPHPVGSSPECLDIEFDEIVEFHFNVDGSPDKKTASREELVQIYVSLIQQIENMLLEHPNSYFMSYSPNRLLINTIQQSGIVLNKIQDDDGNLMDFFILSHSDFAQIVAVLQDKITRIQSKLGDKSD